jgi:uncharacterized protein
MMCFAAQWVGEREVMFFSEYHDSREEMVHAAHRLLNEADAVITYNGDGFDIPHLNREFLELGLTPPSPYASIDLLKTVRKQFRNASNKLDWIVQHLGIGAKTSHTGFQLWLDCMRGDAKAWELMKRYNMQDVRVTGKLYKRILPWITAHPNVSLRDGHTSGCPNCGSFKAIKDGHAYTAMGKFPKYQCKECGKYYRVNARTTGSTVIGVK